MSENESKTNKEFGRIRLLLQITVILLYWVVYVIDRDSAFWALLTIGALFFGKFYMKQHGASKEEG